MSTVIAAGLSHVGLVREHNEDSYCADPETHIFIVADGMGGHAAGEVASKIAVERVFEAWSSLAVQRQAADYARHGDIDRRQALIKTLRGHVMVAHQSIVDRALADSATRGMGTTFTGCLIAGGDAFFAHAGDSRAFLVRDRIPVLLSEDHTISSQLRAVGIEQGLEEGPTPERFQGILTNALGMADASKVSLFVLPLYSGDRLVLCSDGIHDYVDEVEVGKIVLSAPSPALAAQGLVQRALDGGGADNATVIVIKVVEAGDTTVPSDVRQKREAAIAGCALFAGLTPQQILQALRVTTPRRYEKGRSLPRVALEDRVAYIVLEGSVSTPEGKAVPGDVLCAEALAPELQTAPAGQIVVDEDCELLMIRRNDFDELCQESEELAQRLYPAVTSLVARRSMS